MTSVSGSVNIHLGTTPNDTRILLNDTDITPDIDALTLNLRRNELPTVTLTLTPQTITLNGQSTGGRRHQ
jgi:hypothetical protein